MAVQTAAIGDTVVYRDAKGRTRNATVIGLAPVTLFCPTKGLGTAGKSHATATKASGSKQTDKYFKR